MCRQGARAPVIDVPALRTGRHGPSAGGAFLTSARKLVALAVRWSRVYRAAGAPLVAAPGFACRCRCRRAWRQSAALGLRVHVCACCSLLRRHACVDGCVRPCRLVQRRIESLPRSAVRADVVPGGPHRPAHGRDGARPWPAGEGREPGRSCRAAGGPRDGSQRRIRREAAVSRRSARGGPDRRRLTSRRSSSKSSSRSSRAT